MSPEALGPILKSELSLPEDERLLVGNSSRDDAAVYDLGGGRALISTTDFFMPIVDDPREFGRIAAVNAISDVYAMGGTPAVAIAILGWPIKTLPLEIAGQVVEGGRLACAEAGIVLAGGHSIDSPEPIFGLAVTGLVDHAHLKRNDTGQAGDVLFLTKGLGVGILTTAEKKGLLRPGDERHAVESMTRLNTVGADLGRLETVHALTDVTGFGLLGHLVEMCQGAGVSAAIEAQAVPTLCDLEPYLEAGAVPGGTNRNFESYGHDLGELSERDRAVFCDPQTAGGLLVAVAPSGADEVQALLRERGWHAEPIGRLEGGRDDGKQVVVS